MQQRTGSAPTDDPQTRGLRHPALDGGGRAAVPRSEVPLAMIRPSTATMPTTEPLAATTWHLERGRRHRVEVMALGLAALGLAVSAISGSTMARDRPDLVGGVLLLASALLLFVAAVALARATRRIRLIVSDDQLTCARLLSTVAVRWDDLEGLSAGGNGIYRGIGVRLRRPGVVAGLRLQHRLGLGAAGSILPLEPFATPFEGSALEADLRLRCPRLFSEPHLRPVATHV